MRKRATDFFFFSFFFPPRRASPPVGSYPLEKLPRRPYESASCSPFSYGGFEDEELGAWN